MPRNGNERSKPGIWKSFIRMVDNWKWEDTENTILLSTVSAVIIIILLFFGHCLFYTDSPVDYYISQKYLSEKFETKARHVYDIKADIRFENDFIVATVDTLEEAEVIRDRLKTSLNK